MIPTDEEDRQDPAQGEGAPDEPHARKSRSQKKREARAVHDIGEQLVGLSDTALSALSLDEDLVREIVLCRSLKKSARSRQLRLVAKLLRQRDTAPIEARLSEASAVHGQAVAREQANEAWRARLITEGDGALSELVDVHPEADVASLRRLIRAARVSPETPRTVRARRELLRAVRALRKPQDGP